MENEQIIAECVVCGKNIEKDIQVLKKTEHPEFLIAEAEVCSERCDKIAKETLNNRMDTCGDCGCHMPDYDGRNGYRDDYKERKLYPICDKCTDEFIKLPIDDSGGKENETAWK